MKDYLRRKEKARYFYSLNKDQKMLSLSLFIQKRGKAIEDTREYFERNALFTD